MEYYFTLFFELTIEVGDFIKFVQKEVVWLQIFINMSKNKKKIHAEIKDNTIGENAQEVK